MINLIDNLKDIIRERPTVEVDYHDLHRCEEKYMPKMDKELEEILKIGMKTDVTYPCGKRGTQFEKLRRSDVLSISVFYTGEGNFLYEVENDGLRIDPKHKNVCKCEYTSNEIRTLRKNMLF